MLYSQYIQAQIKHICSIFTKLFLLYSLDFMHPVKEQVFCYFFSFHICDAYSFYLCSFLVYPLLLCPCICFWGFCLMINILYHSLALFVVFMVRNLPSNFANITIAFKCVPLWILRLSKVLLYLISKVSIHFFPIWFIQKSVMLKFRHCFDFISRILF